MSFEAASCCRHDHMIIQQPGCQLGTECADLFAAAKIDMRG
jgi:hypothetical protein